VGLGEHGVPVGQYHPRAKLTDEQVRELLNLRRRLGHGYATLARMFNISRSQVRNIIKGRNRLVPVTWREGAE